MRRPATATMPITEWTSSGTAASRASRTSRSVEGSPPADGSASASSSSSTKNGLPSERRWIRAARSGSVGRPSIAASSAAVSSSDSRASAIRCIRPVRSSSASHGSAGCRRCSSSERRVIATRIWSARRDRTRNPSVSRVAASDQWTSSTHDQHRRDLGQAPEHAEERVEQPRLEPDLLRLRPGGTRLDRGHEAGQVGSRRTDDRLEPFGIGVPDQLAEDLDDGAVRQSLVADVGARAAEDEHPASLGRGRQLPDEPGLADAGFARDQQVRRRPADRGVQREDPRVQLGARGRW